MPSTANAGWPRPARAGWIRRSLAPLGLGAVVSLGACGGTGGGHPSTGAATCRAMNASAAPHEHAAVGPAQNNGINEFMFVLRRANFLLPPRSLRAFPLLPGRDRAWT